MPRRIFFNPAAAAAAAAPTPHIRDALNVTIAGIYAKSKTSRFTFLSPLVKGYLCVRSTLPSPSMTRRVGSKSKGGGGGREGGRESEQYEKPVIIVTASSLLRVTVGYEYTRCRRRHELDSLL